MNQPVSPIKLSILVAEDNPAVREFIARALTGAGHDVTPVADGKLALEELAKTRFDVLVTDIVMPNVDGIALALAAAGHVPSGRVAQQVADSVHKVGSVVGQRACGLAAH